MDKTSKPSELLSRSVEEWNRWREENPDEPVDLSGADLTGLPLDHANLRDAVLDGARLEGASLRGADLMRASLVRSVLKDANLASAVLEEADLTEADLRGVDLTRAHLSYARMTNASVAGATLAKTNLDGTSFGSEHHVLQDDAHRVVFNRRDRILNWGRMRDIGELPLFGISWSGFLFSIILIQTIDHLNSTEMPFGIPALEIDLPHRVPWLLLSTLLLVIGTTTYRLACPKRVRTFSETRWVEELGHARLQYLTEKVKRRKWQWAAAVFSFFGAVATLGLTIDRLVYAFGYMLSEGYLLP